jgi:transcriptional regulator with XRE-family HTH domain
MAEKTKKTFNEEVGRRIAQKRIEHELTQHRLGLMVGASGSMVAAWEEGASPNLYYVMRLCSALETTPSYLLTGKGR